VSVFPGAIRTPTPKMEFFVRVGKITQLENRKGRESTIRQFGGEEGRR